MFIKTYIKYILITILCLFSTCVEVEADDTGHYWTNEELTPFTTDDLKVCVYKGDDSLRNIAYAEITPDDKIRASIGDDYKEEVYNWTDDNGDKYWTNALSVEMKPIYQQTGECLPILLESKGKIYLSTWGMFLKDFQTLENPEVYYIDDVSENTEYTCDYNLGDSTISVNYSSGWSMTSVDSISAIKVSPSTRANEEVRKNKTYCPSIQVCDKGEDRGMADVYRYVLYTDKTFIVLNDFTDDDCKTLVCTGGENCDPEKSKQESEYGVCFAYNMYMNIGDVGSKSLTELASNYKDCSTAKNCSQKDRIIYLNEYNKRLDELKNLCSNYISIQNYSEDDPGCMKFCLNLEKEIYSLEKDYGIIRTNQSECPISASIISFAYNILKWAKYIVPALVVILSILDFIKAIASQSEDDMKKAQGKFVKRLIVAAILFLLPLIVNFMLKTFGLYNSTCDITNLFG